MKVKIISFIITLFLVLTIFIPSANAQTYEVVIYDGANSLGHLIVDSSGDLYLVWENSSGTPDDVWISKSIDDGENWVTTNEFSFTNDTENLYGAVIDSNNIIHIATKEELPSGAEVWIRHYTYNTNTEVFSSATIEQYEIQSLIDSRATITVDKDNNVYLFYSISKGNDPEWSRVYCLIRNAEGSWSGKQSVFYESTTQNSQIFGLSADTDSIGDVYLSFILEEGVAGEFNELYCIQYDRSLTIWNEIQPLGETIQDYQGWSTEGSMTNMLIDANDDIHIVFQVEDTSDDAFIKYAFANNYDGTWYNETIFKYNNYDNIDPSISYSDDGNIHIVWVGRDVFYNDRDITMGQSGNFNDWDSYLYYAIDSSDNMIGTTQAYQNYPYFTELNNDLIGCTLNDTDDVSMFFNEGDFQFLSEGGAGQQGGDLDEYEQRCTGALLYDEQVYTSNVSNYMESIGDITIKGLELYVNDNQIEVVTNDEDDYTGWVNGINIGNPEYIFQTSPTRYKLQWVNLDVNVGTNDIITEFQNAQQGIFAYWWHIPLGYTDIAKYGGTAGDGYFDGTLFGSALGLGTCIYYDVNVPTESDNTYSLNLMSNDPHWKGNTTSFSITVDGSTSWTYVIQNPNNEIVWSQVFPDGDNIFYIEKVIPEYWITGEYIIYALDWDAYPTGLSVAENITFNVSEYGGSLTNWMIKASINPIVVGTYQSLSYFVPDGEVYALSWWYFPKDEFSKSGYIKQGVGDGEIHTIQNVKLIDEEGKWAFNLENRTSSNTVEWTVYQDTFQAVGQISNYIQITEGSRICIQTGYTILEGFYDGDVGTLWVYKNNDTFKTYALPYGDFKITFQPNKVEQWLGVYQVYITNIEQEILEWSEGLSIEVIDCGDIPIDPLIVPMYKGNVIMGGILTLILIVVLMLLPYGFMMMLSKAGQTVTIPALVPIGFGCVGFIFSSAMQFIDPMYLVAFLVLIAIFGFILGYFKFAKGSEG